jgi:protein-disulfide isomerase
MKMEKNKNRYLVIGVIIAVIIVCFCLVCTAVAFWSLNTFIRNEELGDNNSIFDFPTDDSKNAIEIDYNISGFEEVEVSVDDDPVKGDLDDAKVVIVEFGDYECPFCKRYYDETFQEINQKYIETGKVAYVYRDFPLSIHNPMATEEAIAAECIQTVADDEAYFEFHDLIYANTTSNGSGLETDDLYIFAETLDLEDEFKNCYESELSRSIIQSEINSDVSDGVLAGMAGTPAFVVGVLDDDGYVKGVMIGGAYPFSTFEDVVEHFLDQLE